MYEIYQGIVLAVKNDCIESMRIAAIENVDFQESDALHHAAEDGNCSVLNFLLDIGFKNTINEFDADHFTPLMRAAMKGHIDIVRVLLESGADVNAYDEPSIGNTVLREVVETAEPELIKMLIDAGADPLIPGWMQLTAIDKAKERLEIASNILKLLKTPSSTRHASN